jgi:hypothetical protein
LSLRAAMFAQWFGTTRSSCLSDIEMATDSPACLLSFPFGTNAAEAGAPISRETDPSWRLRARVRRACNQIAAVCTDAPIIEILGCASVTGVSPGERTVNAGTPGP